MAASRRFAMILLVYAASASSLFPEQVRILVPQSTSSVPFFELERRDESEDIIPGFELAVEPFANHTQALARLLNSDVEMLFTGSSVGWGNHLAGGPMKMVGTGIWGVSSIVGKEDSFSGFDSLRGKILAVPFPGAPLDLQLRYLLKQNGIDPEKDLKIVYAPFAQAAGQILGGQIDAAPLPEPLATALVVGKGLTRYIRVQDAWAEVNDGDPLSPQVSLFATSGNIDDLSEFLILLLRAWAAVSEDITAEPSLFAGRYAERLGQPEPVVTAAIQNTIFAVPEPAETRKRVDRYITMVSTEGMGGLPVEDFYFLP